MKEKFIKTRLNDKTQELEERIVPLPEYLEDNGYIVLFTPNKLIRAEMDFIENTKIREDYINTLIKDKKITIEDLKYFDYDNYELNDIRENEIVSDEYSLEIAEYLNDNIRFEEILEHIGINSDVVTIENINEWIEVIPTTNSNVKVNVLIDEYQHEMENPKKNKDIEI